MVAVATLVAALWLARRPRGDEGAALTLIQQTIGDLRTANQAALAELRIEFQRTMGATEQQVLEQTGSTRRALTELSGQLGRLAEQSARIGDLAKDIGSLQDLLRAPKLRGGFGQLLMERLLAECLPADAFELEYPYRDGSRVDAVVRYGGKLVPIDAKFPLESFNALAAATDEADRRVRRRAFLQQVRRHVDAVARYVAPQEGTIDFALMYVPAENVFYETVIREDSELDLREYCAQRHVIPTSPNTLLAYLQLVALGLRGLAMQERTRELQQGIAHVAREFERFQQLHEQLGRHLDNAAKKFVESERALDRTQLAIEGLAQVPLASGVEQPRLPLPEVDEPRPFTLPDAGRDAVGDRQR